MAKQPGKRASGKGVASGKGGQSSRAQSSRAQSSRKAAGQKRGVAAANPVSANPVPARAPVRAAPLPRTVSGFALPDAEIERSLLNDDNKSLLRDYFGDAQYEELRALAGAASRAGPRGDRILILPGIMGSKLGYDRPEDTLWFDPIDIHRGRLSELALSAGTPVKPVGVILLTYLKLKLRLRFQNFDAEFVPFDWRRSIAALGRELASFIDASDRPVQIVAHSMGGLVSRAALSTVGANLKRIVMLGTPNFGSLASVQAFRGVGDTVGKLAWLDGKHDAAGLARIFGEFPGLIEMIPAPRTTSLDLFDLANWPVSGERPAMAALQAARDVQGALPTGKAGVDIVMIAGCNQETVVDARLAPERPNQPREFAYSLSREGDGTVPLKCALLPTANRTYYVEDSHGSLPGNGEIQRALPSLLSSGATNALGTTPPASRAGTRTMLESDLARTIAASPTEMPGVEDQRRLLAEFAAPAVAGDPTPGVADPVVPRKREALSERLVIGRGGQHRIEITIAKGSITDAQAEMYVVGVFKNVETGGAANAIDAVMGGALKDLMRRRMFGANLGEVSIIPAGRHPLRSNGVALVGLGSFDSFDARALDIVGENLVRLFSASCIEDFAVVPIGAGSSDQTIALFANLMAGFLRGLKEADPDQRFRGITICEIDPDRCETIQDELYRLAGTSLFSDVELTLRTKQLPRTIIERSETEQGTEREPKIYLLVREEPEQMGIPSGLTASLLTSGSMAAIHSGHRPFDPDGNDALGEHLRALNDIGGMSPQQLAAFGEKLGRLTLADTVREALGQSADHHLVVVHDALASRIPWETLRIGGRAPSLGKGMSHRYEAANLAVAKWPGHRVKDQRLGMLLVIDPTQGTAGELKGAQEEGRRIEAICAELGPAIRLTVLRGAEASKAALIEHFRSGRFDVVHYAGHAFFDPLQRTRSGLVCAGREILSGEDLASVGTLPTLMFFNACEAARVRGNDNFAVTDPQAGRSNNTRNVVGLAEALLRGGVANLLGTYWPVGDAAASTFGEIFYRQLIGGATLDTAIHAARSGVAESGSPDWANYVFYGDPEFQMKDAVVAAPASVAEPRAVRVTVRYDPSAAELIACVPIQTPPPEASPDLDVGTRGAWIEVADAQGHVVHRQPLRDPHAGAETTDEGGAFVRLQRESQVETVSLDLPWPGAGATVIVHARPAKQRGARSRTLARGTTERGRFDLVPRPVARTREALPPVTIRPIWGHQNPNALTLAFFAEGFTIDEMDSFHAMVTRCVTAFENVEPFRSLKTHLRVVEVATPSNASGLAGGFAQDTAFRARTQGGSLGRVILIEQQRAATLLNQLFDTSALALVIVNTPDYGGSGGAATVFSCEPNWGTEICLHELGHSLFDLADEYEAAGQPGDTVADEANVSTTADRAHLKWADLVKPTTPLPTQREGQAAPAGAEVGAYEGARYQSKGVFRAQPDCKMRTPGKPYCAVCERAIRKALARHAP